MAQAVGDMQARTWPRRRQACAEPVPLVDAFLAGDAPAAAAFAGLSVLHPIAAVVLIVLLPRVCRAFQPDPPSKESGWKA